MKKHRLRHQIVIVPGISGSVLQKDGKDLWAFSSRSSPPHSSDELVISKR